MKLTHKSISLSLLLSSSLLAAQAPNIADVERNIKPPKEVEQQKSKLVDIGGVKEYKAPLKDIGGKTIFVKGFEIEGNSHISKEKLLKKLESFANKDLTFADIQEVAAVITKTYRDEGFFVSRAYIPHQDISDSIVKIVVIEGNYGELILENNSLIQDKIVQWLLDHAKRENIVSTHTLERAMLIINDTPGAVVTKADVMPGREVGTSDFIIGTEATQKYDGYIIGDNYGSRYTGKNRLMVGINFNSPFKIGDKISLSGLVSQGTNLKNGRISYAVPLMANGLRGEFGYSHTNYSLVEEYKSLDAVGTSKAFDATFTYPIIRTRLENLSASLSFANKDLSDEIRSANDKTEKDIQNATLSFDYNLDSLLFKKYDSQTLLSFAYTYGNLDFKDSAKKLADKNGANTQGNYSKVLLTLGKKIVFTDKITLESSLKYQHSLASKNLDGSEDFSIGGSNGVKVYPDSELSAENGYLLNIEAKYKLPNIDQFSNQLGLFYDRGRAYMADNTVGFEAKSLQDIGVGYYTSYKDFFGKLQVAWTLNSDAVQSEPTSNSKVLFQGGWMF